MDVSNAMEAWLATLPPEESTDPVWRLQAYRLARFAVTRAWPLASKIRQAPLGQPIAAQLWRSTAAIPSDIAEGFSRSSPADRIRFLEYALGSTREALSWFAAAQLMLPATDMSSPVAELRSTRNLLLKMISSQRARLPRKPVFG
jgi:four helix bundle protein